MPVTILEVANSSREISEKLIAMVRSYRPRTIIGNNCYSGDNRVLAYHQSAYRGYGKYFRSVSVKDEETYAFSFRLNIIGVNNIDHLVYIRAYNVRQIPFIQSEEFSSIFGESKAKTRVNHSFRIPMGSNAHAVQQDIFEYNLND